MLLETDVLCARFNGSGLWRTIAGWDTITICWLLGMLYWLLLVECTQYDESYCTVSGPCTKNNA